MPLLLLSRPLFFKFNLLLDSFSLQLFKKLFFVQQHLLILVLQLDKLKHVFILKLQLLFF